jgi:hypothetical protein
VSRASPRPGAQLQVFVVEPGLAMDRVHGGGLEPRPRLRQNMARFQMSQARLSRWFAASSDRELRGPEGPSRPVRPV